MFLIFAWAVNRVPLKENTEAAVSTRSMLPCCVRIGNTAVQLPSRHEIATDKRMAIEALILMLRNEASTMTNETGFSVV